MKILPFGNKGLLVVAGLAKFGGMKLEDYLIRTGLSPAAFARLIGAKSRTTIHRYLLGERKPSKRMLQRITQATNGRVTGVDFEQTPPPVPANNPSLLGQPIQRRLFGWSRLQGFERARLETISEWIRQGPPDGYGPSPVVDKLRSIFGQRLRERNQGRDFELDGRPIALQALVEKANRVLAKQRKPLIKYPFVNPIYSEDK